MATGRVNPNFRLEDQGIEGLGNVHYNLMEPALIEAALKRGEGTLGNGGAFLVTTGKFTGRSPKDKHVVKSDSVKDTIWWENNAAMTPEGFDNLYVDMLEHMKGGDYQVQDLIGGADPKHSINVRVVTELAWHGLFIRTMLRRPDREDLDDFVADFTVINCPSFQADPKRHDCRSETVIAMNFDRKMILIGGTEYAGENKKSVFTLLNYLLRLGWSHGDEEIIPQDKAIEWFDLDAVGKSAARFDFTKLENLNGHYLREAEDARLVALITPHLGMPVDEAGRTRLLAGMDGLKQRAKTVTELADSAKFYLIPPKFPLENPKAAKLMKEDSPALLHDIAGILADFGDWREDALEARLREIAEERELGFGKVAQPLRAALTGSNMSPGLFEVMQVLGKDECLKRLNAVPK